MYSVCFAFGTRRICSFPRLEFSTSYLLAIVTYFCEYVSFEYLRIPVGRCLLKEILIIENVLWWVYLGQSTRKIGMCFHFQLESQSHSSQRQALPCILLFEEKERKSQKIWVHHRSKAVAAVRKLRVMIMEPFKECAMFALVLSLLDIVILSHCCAEPHPMPSVTFLLLFFILFLDSPVRA